MIDDSASQIRGLDETLTERRESAKLVGSEEGVQLVKAAQDQVFDSTEKILLELSAASETLKFTCQRHDAVTFAANANFNVTLHMNLRRLASNSASSASFTVCVFTQPDRLENKFDILQKEEFTPSFKRDRQVVWQNEAKDRTFSNEGLVGHAIEVFRAELERKTLAP
jgi:hypothetical protein